MIEVKAARWSEGWSYNDETGEVRKGAGTWGSAWRVLRDGVIVDSFLTKARAEAKAKLLRSATGSSA